MAWKTNLNELQEQVIKLRDQSCTSALTVSSTIDSAIQCGVDNDIDDDDIVELVREELQEIVGWATSLLADYETDSVRCEEIKNGKHLILGTDRKP